MNANYRQHRQEEFRRAIVAFQDGGDDRALVSLVGSLVGDVLAARNALEQERSNRKDQVRRKRVGQAITRRLLDGVDYDSAEQ